jgi:signal transduction histidine kinase/ActR/RegA family two-component response regulator
LFSARYLEFKVQCRNLYRIANSLALSNLIFAAVMPFLSLSVTLLNVLFVFSPLNVLVLLLMFKISIGNKHPIAIYYSVATIAGLSGVAIKFMSQLGLVEVTVLTYHAATLGFLVQNLIFAYCVAAGVLSIQHQRDKLAELNEVSRNDALEAIKESNRLKNRFLELISHELRTPMNGVQGSIELLAMTPLTQEGKTYLDTAQQSSSEMMLLVDAILSFAEIQTGVIKVKKRLFSLSTVLKPVCKKTSQQCQAKNISFMLDFDHSSTDYFWGDDRKIANIVAILLDNALRSTHVGGVKLSVSVTRSLAQENEFEVFFAISDTGAGMPASEYDRLFNTYSMTGNEHHFVEDTAGGGIGLPLSKELIQLLGGELTVYSMPESGSELSFTLKLTSATESEQNVYLGQAQQSGDVDRRNATDHLAGKTILVAEDNNINLMVLSAILKKFQCRVLTAVNGYDVLKLAFSHHVDAILMDCQMPEMDGFEATRQIRESDHAIKDVPIIAVTANAIEGNSERCIISGMNDYLKKPIKSSDVVEKLVYWLSIKTE